jgi:hypothetical protein
LKNLHVAIGGVKNYRNARLEVAVVKRCRGLARMARLFREKWPAHSAARVAEGNRGNCEIGNLNAVAGVARNKLTWSRQHIGANVAAKISSSRKRISVGLAANGLAVLAR